MRKVAKASGYGVGILFQRIRQDGNILRIEFHGGLGVPLQELRLDSGVEIETLTEEGNICMLKSRWVGSTLRLDGTHKQDGKPMHACERYLEKDGSQMVQEITTFNGDRVRRIFKKAS